MSVSTRFRMHAWLGLAITRNDGDDVITRQPDPPRIVDDVSNDTEVGVLDHVVFHTDERLDVRTVPTHRADKGGEGHDKQHARDEPDSSTSCSDSIVVEKVAA